MDLVLCELPAANLPRLESYSPFCLKAHRTLELLGFSYQRRHGNGPMAFKQLNPAVQVPVLLIDGEPVADSTRIVSRLDAESVYILSRDLDDHTRAEAWLWEEFADSVLNGFLVAARWIDDDNWPLTKAAYFGDMPGVVRAIVPGLLRRSVRKSLWARDVIRPNAKVCWARFEETLDKLDARAPRDGYWLGDAVSRADIAIFAQLWSLRTDLTFAQSESLERRSRLLSYLMRVDRACLQRRPVSRLFALKAS
jgi:glutathione S-transferase